MLFTKNLYVKIYYSVNNNEHILSCDGDSVKLDNLLLEIDKNPHGYANKDNKYKGILDDDLPKELEDFFYTIVSNYSIQSFISSNYECDAYVHQNKFDGNQYDREFKSCWIDPIFHKNDGYKRSIVLNPFRRMGNIDMERELNLSKDRFIALVVKDKDIDDTYSLEKITYSLSKEKDTDLKKYYSRFFLEGKDENFEEYIKSTFYPEKDLDEKIHNDIRLKCLVDFYGFNITKESPYVKKLCLLYLYKKISQIIYTYTEYHSEYAMSTPFDANGVSRTLSSEAINIEKTKKLLNNIFYRKSSFNII